MPTPTTYTYDLFSDFPGGACNRDKLIAEIHASSIVTALDDVDVSNGVQAKITFKDVLSIADKATLDGDTANPAGGLIAAHDNTPNAPILQPVTLSGVATDPDGSLIVATSPRSGMEVLHVSHNFCDPCSWYQKSTRHVDQPCSEVSPTEFDITGHTNLIDLRHGRVHNERMFVAESLAGGGHGWTVEVKVDSVLMTEHSPLKGVLNAGVWERQEDGDYWIDHEAGTIHFLASQTGKTVTATFSKAGDSDWAVDVDSDDNDNQIEYAEAQFSTDFQMESDIEIQFYGLVDVFAPNLTPDPLPPGTLIPLLVDALGTPLPYTYKTANNFIDEATSALPTIPAVGDPAHPRSSPAQHVFPFKYNAKRQLLKAGKMKMVLTLGDHLKWSGTRATVTFYGVKGNSGGE